MVLPVVEPARHVELPLDIADVAAGTGIRAKLAVKIVRHVLDRVQPQTVELGHRHLPANRAAQIRPHILLVEILMLLQKLHRYPVVRPEPDPLVALRPQIAHPPLVLVIPRIPHIRHMVVKLRILRMPHKMRLVVPVPLVKTVVLVRRLVRNINQIRQPQMHHLPRIIPVPRIVPLPVKPVLRLAQVEILRRHPRIHIHRCGLVIPRNIKRPVVHNIIRIHPNPKPVRHLDHVEQLRLRAVAPSYGAALIPPAQIERIPQIVAHRQPPAALRRRRNPNRGISRFRQLRHLVGHLPPARVEILQHRLPRRRPRQRQPEQTNPYRQHVARSRTAQSHDILPPSGFTKPEIPAHPVIKPVKVHLPLAYHCPLFYQS